MFISVDLPDPDAPMIATISPASMVRFTSFSTTTSRSPEGKRRVTPVSSSMGCELALKGDWATAPDILGILSVLVIFY